MSVDLDSMSADLSSPHQAKSCLTQEEVREEIIEKLEENIENFDEDELKEVAIQATKLLSSTEQKLVELRKQNIKQP